MCISMMIKYLLQYWYLFLVTCNVSISIGLCTYFQWPEGNHTTASLLPPLPLGDLNQ